MVVGVGRLAVVGAGAGGDRRGGEKRVMNCLQGIKKGGKKNKTLIFGLGNACGCPIELPSCC